MIFKIMVNTISLSRIILTILLAAYIVKGGTGILLPTVLILVILLTDLLDGRLARKWSACSNLGAIIDVLADLFFMMTVSIALVLTDIFPVWMLIVFIGKFLEFWCTSSYVRRSHSRSHVFMFDSLGRKIVGLFYLLPYLAILISAFLPYEIAYPVMNLLCIPIAAGAVVSSFRRIKACVGIRSTIYNT